MCDDPLLPTCVAMSFPTAFTAAEKANLLEMALDGLRDLDPAVVVEGHEFIDGENTKLLVKVRSRTIQKLVIKLAAKADTKGSA